MSNFDEQLFIIVDLLAKEYGWSLEYCCGLPNDVVMRLVKRIHKRKLEEARLWTKLIGAASAAGFSGKLDKLDDIFTDVDKPKQTEVDSAAWKGQVKSMWIRMQTKDKKNVNEDEYKRLNEEFEKKWSSGENISF